MTGYKKIAVWLLLLAAAVCGAVPAGAVAIEPSEIFTEPDPAYDPTDDFDDLPAVDPSLLPVDFAALQEENPDIYAWITIPDTRVDYPVLQSPEGADRDHYLNTNLDGTTGYPGCLYTQNIYNTRRMTDRVTIIYGHNMSYGDMFGTLRQYHDESYRLAHPEVIIYTPEHIFTYRIVFTVTYDDRLIPLNYDWENQEEYDAFIASLYEIGTDPTWIDPDFDLSSAEHLVVLSTCNGNEVQRYLVGAALIDIQ